MSRIEKLLTQASECLPDGMQIDAVATVARANDFHEFMKHHEWGLAMETLEEIATNMNPAPPSTFWALLVQAARIMNSQTNLIRYQSYVD